MYCTCIYINRFEESLVILSQSDKSIDLSVRINKEPTSICTYTTDQVRAITQNNGSTSIALTAQRIDLLATLYERTNRLIQVCIHTYVYLYEKLFLYIHLNMCFCKYIDKYMCISKCIYK